MASPSRVLTRGVRRETWQKTSDGQTQDRHDNVLVAALTVPDPFVSIRGSKSIIFQTARRYRA